jgi:GNAT superfamily N-acetyltransferase
MTTRILPHDEWHRLAGTEAEGVPFPDGSLPVVVERDGQIVACHVLMPFWHVECLWVHPDFRKTTVGGRLWAAVKKECGRLGIHAVLTAALTEEVKSLLAHVHGVPLPGEHFVIPVKE